MLNFELVLDQIIERANGIAGGRGGLGFGRSDVALAFQSVYYASIRREEGEVVRPHLVLISGENLGTLGTHAALLEAKNPSPLTSELLRKRSLAFDRRTTSFVVTPSGNGLVLVGVAHWAWSGSDKPRGSTGIPMLRFDSEDAGTIVVAFDQTRLGLLRDGNFFPTRPNVFASPAFKNALKSTFYRVRESDERARSFMAGLHYLVRSAMSCGLGATIIIVDDFTPIELSKCTESGEYATYSMRKSHNGTVPAAIRTEVLDTDASQVEVASLTPARKAYLDFVARMACVDGALIAGIKFNPIVYGVKLRAPPSEVPVFLGGDSDHEIPAVLQGVGTRHTSALNFISHVKRGVAITISSDGPVSAFAWMDDRLSWWKNAVEL